MKKFESLTFITGNMDKVEHTRRYISFPLEHLKVDLDEIQSLDVREVVEHKARGAYEIVKKPVLVEDTFLTFRALGKLPGPFIKWFLQEVGNEGMCRMLDVFADRRALAEVTFGLYDGDELRIFEGKKEGIIVDKPRVTDVFGWNAIFVPEGSEKTYSQMDKEELKNFSPRKMALEKMEEFLK